MRNFSNFVLFFFELNFSFSMLLDFTFVLIFFVILSPTVLQNNLQIFNTNTVLGGGISFVFCRFRVIFRGVVLVIEINDGSSPIFPIPSILYN